MKSTEDTASLLYHRAYKPISLGCSNCPEKGLCGGLQTSGGQFDCLAFCECKDPSTCQYVCPNKLDYMARVLDVFGFGFENIPRVPKLTYPVLPRSVPLLYHAYRRKTPLKADSIAVPLAYLINRKTGMLRFTSRAAIARHFGFAERAGLVITGVAMDQPIEDYWSFRRATRIPKQLAAIGPDLVTGPNYSTPLDTPRWENLYNMKRIPICWSELITAGLPTSLHLNACSDRDWERWTEFVVKRREVVSVAYEFATGPARLERGDWHTQKLVELAKAVPRRLQLIVRGGLVHLEKLNDAFDEVVFIDSTPFMKSVNRQKCLKPFGGKMDWLASGTPENQPIDSLLEHNVATHARVISQVIAKQLTF